MNVQNLIRVLQIVGIGMTCVFAVTGVNILLAMLLNRIWAKAMEK